MNRLIVARPLLRAAVQSNIVAVPSRLYDDWRKYEIGPPASLNQLPNPEGDWTTKHQEKQSKYNAILGASAVVFAGTLFYFVKGGVMFFNATLPDTYE